MRFNRIECSSCNKESYKNSVNIPDIEIGTISENFVEPDNVKLNEFQRVNNLKKQEQLTTKKIMNKIRNDFCVPETVWVDSKKKIANKPKNFFSKKFIESNTNDEKVFFSNKRIYLYKTEMCRSYNEMGYCKYGDRCQFSHSDVELRDVSRHPKYKTETCRVFWEQGTCPYGKRCCFLHSEVDLDKEEISDQIPVKLLDLTSNLEIDDEEYTKITDPDTVENLIKASEPVDKASKRNLIELKRPRSLFDTINQQNLLVLKTQINFSSISVTERDHFNLKANISETFLNRFFRCENLIELLETRSEYKEIDYTFVNKEQYTNFLCKSDTIQK
ncbi:zfp36l2-A [Nucleospora cyclopteri]